MKCGRHGAVVGLGSCDTFDACDVSDALSDASTTTTTTTAITAVAPDASRAVHTDVSEYLVREIAMLRRGLPDHANVRRLLDVDLVARKVVYSPVAGVNLLDLSVILQGDYATRLLYTRSVTRDVLAGLLHLHAHDVVHRDLVPENITLVHGVGAQLGGFGSVGFGTQLRTHTLVGTPEYMAPEMLLALPTDARLESWALGCLVYELLAGQSLFPQSTVPDLLHAILRRDNDPSWPSSRLGMLDVPDAEFVRALVQPLERRPADTDVATSDWLCAPHPRPVSKLDGVEQP